LLVALLSDVLIIDKRIGVLDNLRQSYIISIHVHTKDRSCLTWKLSSNFCCSVADVLRGPYREVRLSVCSSVIRAHR